MQNREPYTVAEQLSSAFKRLSLRRKRSAVVEYTVTSLSENAKFVLARADGTDLQTISPLGALQLVIGRINEDAKEEPLFKKKIARKLFRKNTDSEDEIDRLWVASSERILINEIFTLIKMQRKLSRPVTFGDAFNLVYQSKSNDERLILNKVAKALLLDP